MIGRLSVAVAMVSLAAQLARADAPAGPVAPATPDGAAVEAGDANLEPTGPRHGLMLAGAIGGGLVAGFGIPDSVGRGGALSLRLGEAATPRTVMTLEVGLTVVLHRPDGGDLQTNTNSHVLVGAQYYVNPSLWLRGAGGFGVYDAHQVAVTDIQRSDLMLVGPAMLASLGVDIARFKWAVFGIEIDASAMFNRDGVLFASATRLGLTFD